MSLIKIIPFVLALAVSGPANAQTNDDPFKDYPEFFDVAAFALNTCIDRSQGDDIFECIGTLNRRCYENFARSQADEGRCMWDERSVWAAAYQRSTIELLSAHVDEASANAPAYENRFQLIWNAEAAWQSYAVQRCAAETSQWGAGTIRATKDPRCEIELYAERIRYQRHQFE